MNRKHKATNRKIDKAFLEARARQSIARGFAKQKWIIFCETMLAKGLELTLYEARQTCSKYITLRDAGKSFKVRFSNHRPNKTREINGDCDFFVGRTHLGITTTEQATEAAFAFFGIEQAA